MNKTTMLAAAFAILVAMTFAGAQDTTPEELKAGINDALTTGDQGKLYELLEVVYESGADFALNGKTTEALQMVEIAINAEPNFGRYFAGDERYASLYDNEDFQRLLKGAVLAAIEQNITIPLGSPAPDFELEDVNGAKYKLSDFQGKAVLLNIWATWCPPCQAEIPDLIEVQNEYGGDDFTIMSISVDEAPVSEVRDFASDIGINYPVLIDDGKTAQTYIANAGGIPETYFIDKEGNVAYFIYGGAEKAAFVSAIELLIK